MGIGRSSADRRAEKTFSGPLIPIAPVEQASGVTQPANRRFLIVRSEKSEPTAELSGKSDVEIASDYFLAVAKVRGVTLEQLFREKPELYSWYRELSIAPKYY